MIDVCFFLHMGYMIYMSSFEGECKPVSIKRTKMHDVAPKGPTAPKPHPLLQRFLFPGRLAEEKPP